MTKYLLLIIVLISGCKTPGVAKNDEAIAYLNEVLSIMESHSVNRQKINWEDFRQKVMAKATNAKTIAQTYPAVQYAIKLLGDKHSYFAPVNDDTDDALGPPPILPDLEVPDDIGYIRVRYCMGNDSIKKAYITQITEDIKTRDKDNLKGWVVDLRGNFGGDMAPMLLGISPILGDGIAGYTAYPDGKYVTWQCHDNKLLFDDDVVTNPDTLILKNQNPYVAVLTDTLTASSGEAVTVAFKQRPKTRSFGQHTYGVSTSNEGFTLSDGSRMLLTVAVFADRNKNKYGIPVQPDEIIDPSKALERAIQWLKTR
ncbi:S41 family peptidase [Flavobacterium psychrotrophum]|uniref:S41 family peptidase n=1 Tax=Flavobacterium psychrotrophum TaxID=2294119 RepID=UPI000E318DBB|nr:S41 family peptidase [Flavobacterium psychrotrophum]